MVNRVPAGYQLAAMPPPTAVNTIATPSPPIGSSAPAAPAPQLVVMLPPSRSTPHETAATSWRPGQLLPAQISSSGEGRGLQLQLPQQPPIPLRSGTLFGGALPLAAGDSVTLRVEAVGERTTLTLVQPRVEQQITQQALRQLLPRQEPLVPLLHELEALSPAELERLPPPLRQAIKGVLMMARTPEQLADAAGLRDAIANAGMFLEARLLQHPQRAADNDNKALLLRLAASLLRYINSSEVAQLTRRPSSEESKRPSAPTQEGESSQSSGSRTTLTPSAPPNRGESAAQQRISGGLLDQLQNLLRHTEGNAARQQLQQITTLPPADEPEPQLLSLELPVRHPDHTTTLHLALQHEREGNGRGSGDSWSVTLQFDDPTHGEISCVVSLIDGAISTSVWAASAATATLFENQLGELKRRFESLALPIGTLATYVGRLPRQQEAPIAAPSTLLDLKA